MSGCSTLYIIFCLAHLPSMGHTVDEETLQSKEIVLKYLNITRKEGTVTLKDVIRNEDKNGHEPIHRAAWEGRLDVMMALLQQGAVVNARGEHGQITPLHIAVWRGDENMTEYLLSKDADPNAKDAFGNAPVIYAANARSLKVLKRLLEAGVDIDSKGMHNMTALHKVVLRGDTVTVKFLLSLRADPEIKDQFGDAPINSAARMERLDVIKLLVNSGANINSKDQIGRTVLHRALLTEVGDRWVDYLLSKEADPNVVDNGGSSAIHFATKRGLLGAIKLLLNSGAGVDVIDPDGMTALHLAVKRKDEAVVKYLLSNHANPEVRADRGHTALHVAATSGRLGVIKLLLQFGANISARNEDGMTAMDLAKEKGDKNVVEYLMLNQKNVVEYLMLNHSDVDGIKLHRKVEERDNKSLSRKERENEKKEMAIKIIRKFLNIPGDDNITVKQLINHRNRDGILPLQQVALEGRLVIMKALIQLGANVNAGCSEGHSPLYIAANRNDEEMVEYLLSHHANPDVVDNIFHFPVFTAAINGFLGVIKKLGEYKANLNAKIMDGVTLIHMAAFQGEDELVQYLLSKYVEINVRDSYGNDPLHYAAVNGKVGAVKVLVQSGFDVNIKTNDGVTPLGKAIKNGFSEVLEYLLSQQADPNVRDAFGLTPLLMAVAGGELDLIKLLLRSGAEINAIYRDGETAMDIAARRKRKGVIEHLSPEPVDSENRDRNGDVAINTTERISELLLQSGGDVNFRGNDGMTALLLAAAGGDEDAVERLLSKHADTEARDSYGNAAIHFAVSGGRLLVAKLLLQYKANVNALGRGGMTPLALAAQRGDEPMLRYLLSKRADPNIQDILGNAPLYYAVGAGELAPVMVLMQNGADVKNTRKDGMTAIRLAAEREDKVILEYLLSKYANDEGINFNQKGQNEGKEYFAAVKVIRDLLLDKVYNPQELMKNENTRKKDKGLKLIHFAAEEGRFELVKALVHLGADVNTKSNSGKTALLLASQGGHEEVVRFLLLHRADPLLANNWGDTPLHLAANEGHLNVIKDLLSLGSGVNPNTTGRGGLTALHIAMRKNNEEMADLLLANHANPNAKTKWNATPLLFAIYRGSERIIKKNLENGAKVDKSSTKILNLAIERDYQDVIKFLITRCGCIDGKDENGLTPLNAAVLKENIFVIELLLETALGKMKERKRNSFVDTSSDIKIANSENITEIHNLVPLHIACKSGYTEIVQLLISYGASLDVSDERWYTPLHYATENGHAVIVKMIIGAGVNVNLKDINGTSPLHIACRKGHIKIVKLLLSDPFVYPDIIDARQFLSPLHDAVWNGFIDVVELLLNSGADINIQDDYKQTPLILASLAGHLEIVRMLIDKGGDINKTDKKGMTAVHLASLEGHSEIVKFLISNYNNLVKKEVDNLYTPLHHTTLNRYQHFMKLSRSSTEDGKLETVRVLLSHGSNISAVDKHARTPLHMACRNGFSKIVELLVLNKASTQAKDKSGWIPLQYAASSGHNNIVQNLLHFNTERQTEESYLESSLLISSKGGHYEVVKTFLEYSVDPDTADESNRTSLHLASRGGYTAIARLLLLTFEATTIDAKDKWGWKPLNYAVSWKRHDKTARLLLNIKNKKAVALF